jgi:hypothetical protein
MAKSDLLVSTGIQNLNKGNMYKFKLPFQKNSLKKYTCLDN